MYLKFLNKFFNLRKYILILATVYFCACSSSEAPREIIALSDGSNIEKILSEHLDTAKIPQIVRGETSYFEYFDNLSDLLFKDSPYKIKFTKGLKNQVILISQFVYEDKSIEKRELLRMSLNYLGCTYKRHRDGNIEITGIQRNLDESPF